MRVGILKSSVRILRTIARTFQIERMNFQRLKVVILRLRSLRLSYVE